MKTEQKYIITVEASNAEDMEVLAKSLAKHSFVKDVVASLPASSGKYIKVEEVEKLRSKYEKCTSMIMLDVLGNIDALLSTATEQTGGGGEAIAFADWLSDERWQRFPEGDFWIRKYSTGTEENRTTKNLYELFYSRPTAESANREGK